MKKEVITVKNIVQEERKKFLVTAKSSLFCAMFTAFMIAFLLWLFIGVLKTRLWVLALPIVAFGGFVVVHYCLLTVLDRYAKYHHLKNGCFRVTTDVLINCKKMPRDGRKRYPHTFWFKTYGEHALDTTMHYHTSKNFTMSDDGVFNTAIIGDTFFLVLNKKEKILQIYNTKFFEYKIEK